MAYEKQYSPYTVNIRLRTLRCYLKWLYDEKYLSENISTKLKLLKTLQDTINGLTDSEVKKLLQARDLDIYTGLRDLASIILLLDCGIRVGEMCQLKIDDVDFIID